MFKLKFNPKKEWQCISTLKLSEPDWNQAKFYKRSNTYLTKVYDWILQNTEYEFEISQIKLENHLFGIEEAFISRNNKWMVEFRRELSNNDIDWYTKIKIYINKGIENNPEIKKTLL